MNKFIYMIAVASLFLTSCGSEKKLVIPRAVNTINSAPLEALNLAREDYEILNTITADATVYYRQKSRTYTITNKEDGFSFTNIQGICKFSGILKLGFLSNDYMIGDFSNLQPEEVSRGLAIYRAINLAQQYGADAVIEPTISTNVEQIGKDIVFKSTITAKLIKLKTDN